MKVKKSVPFYFLIIVLFTFVSCSGDKMAQKTDFKNKLSEISDAEWEALSKKKIYFGHQSVGYNIIAGIQDLIKEHPQIKLNIVETTDLKDFNSGLLAHSKVGKNREASTKTSEFSNILKNGIAEHADAVALKFCYVDVTSESDVQNVFDDYVKTINSLKTQYPDLIFIHFTVPLTTIKSSWRTWIKKAIGKNNIFEHTDNVFKNKYNDLLIAKYKGKDPIVDIAMIESTKPDGLRNTYEYNSKTYYSLVPAYTYDGGHLNETGRKRVATEFLIILANAFNN